MKKRIASVILLIAMVLFCVCSVNAAENPEPFLIDTDFSTDVDDVLAISTACYFEDIGMIDIKGVALCSSSTRGAYAMSALLGQHKKWDIPIACDWDDGIPMGSDYVLGMSNFPHSETYFADTTNYYRMMLASSPEKVNIVTLGQLVNISNLLDSQPDVHSPLNGRELVAEKVKCIYIVGGKHNGKLENNIWYSGEDYGNNKYFAPYGQFNGVTKTAMNVANTCTAPIVWLEADLIGTFEVGNFFTEYDKNDIISKALNDFGKPYGSASFDPFAIWIACMDSNDELLMIDKVKGKMTINPGGTSYFTDNDLGMQYRIIKLTNDSWYRDKINQCLLYEYNQRH